MHLSVGYRIINKYKYKYKLDGDKYNILGLWLQAVKQRLDFAIYLNDVN